MVRVDPSQLGYILALCRPALRLNSPVRFAVRLHSNFQEKYATKLQAKAIDQGVTVEELLANARTGSEKLRRSDVADLQKQAKNFRQRYAGASTAEKLQKLPKSKPRSMNLDSFVDVAKLRPHPVKEIEMLWKARFLDTPNAFSGSMSAGAFSKLYINARKYPTFVLPLPHKAHGIELHYAQWSFVTSETVYCLITSLAQYKLHTEYAHPHTTFMLHTNLAADKQIVLTNAVIQGNEISTENAAITVLNLQRFYTADAESVHGRPKVDLLRQFNTGDANFSTEKLIEATETLD